MLDQPTHPLASIWCKLWEVSICEWPLKQTGLVNIKTFSCSYGLSSVLSRLHDCKHKWDFCWIKNHWTWLYSDIVAWDSVWYGNHHLFSDIDTVTTTFHVLVPKYIFPQLQACSADCTEGSCSSDIPSNFQQLFSFNFPFFNFKQ